MFQPQPTPYSPFSSYGVGTSLPDAFPGFQPAGGALVVDSGGPTVFRETIFSPVASSNINAPFSTNNLSQPYKMQSNGVNDLEAQEALARDFQPALEGPLVGEKKSSHAITEEYAKADPIYVAKTAALPQNYSHYRPILGDGNCGWRAVGFSYFETLLRLRDKAQLGEEIARMTSLNNLLTSVGGFQAWLFEDMVEETINLLRDLANTIEASPQAATELLLQRFNNPEISNAIVYHFRLLASSWLKGNPGNYEAFIPDNIGVDSFRKEWIESPNQEIDHIGISVLSDVLLKPVGFALEIVYLDRSEGSQVNTHVFQSEDSNGVPTNPGCPLIHLLYRPSHYDILYKEIPHQSIEVTRNPQINRATHFTQQHSLQGTTPSMGEFSQLELSTLLSIPGFAMPPQPSHHGFPPQYHSPIEQSYTPSPMSTSISPISPGASTTSTSSNLPSTFPAQPPQPATLGSPSLTAPHSFPPTTQLPIHTHLPPPHPSHRPSLHSTLSNPPPLISHASISSSSDLASPTSATSSFRPSKYEWEAAADWQESQPVTFQTSTFKNSHYNTAHYNNPNFQPEEWSPDQDEPIVGRKRSS